MSELTSCCYCTFQRMIRNYGRDNLRIEHTDSRHTPIDVLRRQPDGSWKWIAAFGALNDHCEC